MVRQVADVPDSSLELHPIFFPGIETNEPFQDTVNTKNFLADISIGDVQGLAEGSPFK